ncbi:hypothetical protein BpHYR1_007661 [Brachionus plicatilis]|uniref:Uncharacterized protein n=1 Tax=Brachionus plicatilis TaxID=10195 RepID=A0A3M7TAG0_BRAPC|nr:hypothetical protein BpHYR1_007661 [Brachionus plicatilis]
MSINPQFLFTFIHKIQARLFFGKSEQILLVGSCVKIKRNVKSINTHTHEILYLTTFLNLFKHELFGGFEHQFFLFLVHDQLYSTIQNRVNENLLNVYTLYRQIVNCFGAKPKQNMNKTEAAQKQNKT